MSLGAAIANERRLAPVLAEASPYAAPSPRVAPPAAPALSLAPLREVLARRIVTAALLSLLGIAIAASIPAMTALASSLREGAAPYGPPATLRAAAGIAGNWEASNALAAPPAVELGNAVVAGAAAQHQARLEAALVVLAQAAEAQKAADAAKAAAAPVVTVVAEQARAFSLNAASGLGAGTVLRARITIYGCSGPGGGFCHRMSSGGAPFPGAAACSDNLPFGTKLRIAGDPTGRVYECLDRGRLSPTWIDVYFDNTADGMAWQSSLGTTVADIEIVN